MSCHADGDTERPGSHSTNLVMFLATGSSAEHRRKSLIPATSVWWSISSSSRSFSKALNASRLALTRSLPVRGCSSNLSYSAGCCFGDFAPQLQMFKGFFEGAGGPDRVPGGVQDQLFCIEGCPAPAPKRAPKSPPGGPVAAPATAIPILLFVALLRASNGPGTLLPCRLVVCNTRTYRLKASASSSSEIQMWLLPGSAGGVFESCAAKRWHNLGRHGMRDALKLHWRGGLCCYQYTCESSQLLMLLSRSRRESFSLGGIGGVLSKPAQMSARMLKEVAYLTNVQHRHDSQNSIAAAG
jgi:hypothetical protein